MVFRSMASMVGMTILAIPASMSIEMLAGVSNVSLANDTSVNVQDVRGPVPIAPELSTSSLNFSPQTSVNIGLPEREDSFKSSGELQLPRRSL